MGQNKKKQWPSDYKIEYKYKGLTRKRYTTCFSAELALEQFEEMMKGYAVTEIVIYKWDKYKTPPEWVEVDEFS